MIKWFVILAILFTVIILWAICRSSSRYNNMMKTDEQELYLKNWASHRK